MVPIMTDKVSAHFDRKEFACRCGCGLDVVDVELVAVVEDVRLRFQSDNIGSNVAVEITSGNRCRTHNTDVGGSPKSQHLICKAADIKVWIGWRQRQVPSDEVADYLEATYHDQYGIGRYNTFTHIDVRRERARWDNRNQA